LGRRDRSLAYSRATTALRGPASRPLKGGVKLKAPRNGETQPSRWRRRLLGAPGQPAAYRLSSTYAAKSSGVLLTGAPDRTGSIPPFMHIRDQVQRRIAFQAPPPNPPLNTFQTHTPLSPAAYCFSSVHGGVGSMTPYEHIRRRALTAYCFSSARR
jgi:hypothetical protein